MNAATRLAEVALLDDACSGSEHFVAVLLFDRQRRTWSLDPLLANSRDTTSGGLESCVGARAGIASRRGDGLWVGVVGRAVADGANHLSDGPFAGPACLVVVEAKDVAHGDQRLGADED